MNAYKKIRIFKDKYPYIGPGVWILSVQYFLVQFAASAAWSYPYSLKTNPISDLGNTACGLFSSRMVCSPLHGLMNISFILLGVFMATGALLIYTEFKKTRESFTGFGFMGLAGVGTVLVGLFPENTVIFLHILGAFLPFFFGNLGILILGLNLDLPKTLRGYTIVTGVVSLAAFFLLIAHIYLGLGGGGMERLTSYPQTVWLIVFGLYISKNHFMRSFKT